MKKWLKEHAVISILIAVALALVILLVSSFLHLGNSTPVGKFFIGIVTSIQEPISNLTTNVSNGFRNLFSLRSIASENEALREEVAELKQELILQQFSEQELEELRQLSQVLNYTSVQNSRSYVTGDVIAMDSSNWFNIFTINVGTEQGVQKDAMVINGDGLVGRVYEAGKDWAKVISVIDETNNVSFQVFRDSSESYLGVLTGDGMGGLRGYMLDNDASVIEGDTVLTSGIGIYPQGVVIGRISEVVVNTDSLLKEIILETSVDFKNVQKVMVLSGN
ncbi:MAG: rod shape-determining protein MreC [Firmicutes bacterium]|nr:rod shape-determining protein MreC [Bacillota bacterium]MBR6499906.1 rod shape-determining protein MreC [Bacillota bacterium]